ERRRALSADTPSAPSAEGVPRSVRGDRRGPLRAVELEGAEPPATKRRGWWAGRESNPEHRDYKSRVLAALNYRPVEMGSGGRRASRRRRRPRRSLRGAGVDPLLQALAGLEGEHLARGDLDAVAGLRVATAPRGLAPDAEVAEADDLDVLALLEAAKDDVEDRLDHRGRLPLRQAVVGDRVDQIVLGHREASPPPGCPVTGRPARCTACSLWLRAA